MQEKLVDSPLSANDEPHTGTVQLTACRARSFAGPQPSAAPAFSRVLGCALLAWLTTTSGSALAAPPSAPASPGAAQPSDPNTFEKAASLEQLSLVDLMDLDIKTTTATRSVAVTVDRAPSTIAVITREEIDRYGYRTVPEALATVPGLFIVDDLVTSNVAIRGIHAGTDSWSRTVKFMIDGVPVQYQSNGGALFGPEFIPMDAVQSIEVIRGPASALYGANAFLGVVNVITRTPEAGVHATLSTSTGVVQGNPSLSDGAVLSYRGIDKRPFWTMLSVQGERLDRSGLAPADSSPQRNLYTGRTSEHDISRPIALFGKLGWNGREFGNVRFDAIYQQTDASTAFSEIGVLQPGARTARSNSVFRVDYQLPVAITYDPFSTNNHSVTLHAWGDYGVGRALDKELLVSPGSQIHRNRSAWSVGTGTEVSYVIGPHSLLLGFDHLSVHDSGDELIDINPKTGVRTSRNRPEELAITNLGLFAQVMTTPWEPIGLTASVRQDDNSEWGKAFTYRAAGVARIFEWLSLKAMLGTSFVPPAPSQLNAVPLVLDGGIDGNPSLGSQTAKTYEGAIQTRPLPQLRIDLTGFTTDIFDRVENISVGQLQRAVNLTDSHSRGFEVSGQWRQGPVTLQADVAYQKTELEDPDLPNFRWRLAYDDNAVGGKRPPNFPEVLSHQRVALTLPKHHFEVAASGQYVGSRKATVANIALKGESYELDPYFVLGMHVRTLGLSLIGDRLTELSLHGENVLNTKYGHAGAHGVDIPGLGPSFFLRLKQEL
jgi:outer membrane receptor for ferrienterochelin and colicins